MSKTTMKIVELKTEPKKPIPPDELERMKRDLTLAAEKAKHILEFTKLHFKKNSNSNVD